MLCDLCNKPERGTAVSSQQMRQAVFYNGFNPYKEGLDMLILGDPAICFHNWKGLVSQDNSDWNICAECLKKLLPFLSSAPKAAGIFADLWDASPEAIRKAVSIYED